MKFKTIPCAVALLAAAAFTSFADAHEYYLPGMTFVHPWAEPTAPGAKSAPVYFTVEGVSKADRLVRATTPLAEKVEFRDAGPASKPPLKTITIQPGDTEFTEGKRHLLLTGLKTPLEMGRSYEMTLVFEKGGPVQVQISVGAH